MSLGKGASPWWWAGAAGLGLLLVLLGTLQYRWTGELSRAERERRQARLNDIAARLAHDFDREVTRALATFQPPVGVGSELGDHYRLQWDRWRAEAPYPGLVAGVWLLDTAAGPAETRRFDGSRFVPAPLPSSLEPLVARLDRWPTAPGSRPWRDLSIPLAPRVPALVVPLPNPGSRGRSRPPSRAPGLIVVLLDRQEMRARLFPSLARRELGGEVPDLEWAVVTGEGGVLVSSEPPPPEARLVRPDAVVPLFALLPPEELRELWHATLGSEPPGVEGPPPSLPQAPRLFRHHWPLRMATAEAGAGAWRLLLLHPQGSLEEAVARSRRRNLAVGLGVLALLGATVVLLAVATRRAQALARQRMELVAGVSHELRTPVAAIGSLADNLADGVVGDPGQVRRYGSSIRTEARRLGDLVEQVLELAGIDVRNRLVREEEVRIGDTVREALADQGRLLEEGGVELRVEVADALPLLLGEPDALRRAVGNVVANAVRHGEGAPVTVRVGTAQGAGGTEVVVEVSDSGPGIARDEQSRIFQPFFRGRRAAERQHRGSGLGLALVHRIVAAHGGRVEVRSEPGSGSRFLLHLPVSLRRKA